MYIYIYIYYIYMSYRFYWCIFWGFFTAIARSSGGSDQDPRRPETKAEDLTFFFVSNGIQWFDLYLK